VDSLADTNTELDIFDEQSEKDTLTIYSSGCESEEEEVVECKAIDKIKTVSDFDYYGGLETRTSLEQGMAPGHLVSKDFKNIYSKLIDSGAIKTYQTIEESMSVNKTTSLDNIEFHEHFLDSETIGELKI